MALTVSSASPLPIRIGGTNYNIVVSTMAFDSSYPTDGEAVTANTLGMTTIKSLIVLPYNGYTFNAVDVGTNGKGASFKIKAFGSTVGTEVSNATDLSSLTAVPYIAIGN